MPQIIASTYEILQQIGSGGGGVVYLGQHLRLGKKIAMKADRFKLSEKSEKALRREVEALKNLSHTYIPQVYDFVAEGDIIYTVMDYIEGESFDGPLQRGERFTQPQVIEWARQLLEALCYLHSPHPEHPYGILHSDIKPANIMLTPQGDIRLIDFNIALALGEEGAVAVGRSFGYASPEHYGIYFAPDGSESKTTASVNQGANTNAAEETQTMPANAAPSIKSEAKGKKTIILDVRSDIYGVGATLYHLLTGRRPSKNAVEVEPIAGEGISPAVAAIINKAINKSADLRYQTAKEMLFDINHLHINDPRAKRHKKMRLIAGLPLGALFISGVFAAFVGLKQMERTQNAYALAGYSANALSEGNVPLAVNLALEALPEQNSIFIPPYTPQAIKALTDALGVYDLSDGYKPFQTLTLPSEIFTIALSEDGKTAAAVYAYETAVFYTETAEIIAQLPSVHSALAEVTFINNTLLAYAGEDGMSVYDTEQRKVLWTGKPATKIAVSADKSTIAAIFRDESSATIYNIDGTEKQTVTFDGKKQRVIENDTFANPNDNLLALNKDGNLLAVSFADGSLTVFDLVNEDNTVEIYDASEFFHFEGGFFDIYFAFSATNNDTSVFAVVDMEELAQTGGFESDRPFGVTADESGIFISLDNIVVKIDPVDGEQQEVAYTDADVLGFSSDLQNTIVATKDNGYMFFDKGANRLTKFSGSHSFDFVGLAKDFAVATGRDTPVIRILKREEHPDAQAFAYDVGYYHDEARVNENMTRVMLFSYEGFRLCDTNGNTLRETSIPDAEKVYDQQYSKRSGNLAVIYKDALRIYSGDNGDLLFEKTDLQSTFYAPYGVSILEQNGALSLIDIDTAQASEQWQSQDAFAAYCGLVVDSSFLGDNELIGAARYNDGYWFAVGDGTTGAVYDGTGKKLFDIIAQGQCEAFFTEEAVIISPLHGTPAAYSLKTGKKISDLEQNAYLTYITSIHDYIVSEYITADGERFALLLDRANLQAVASLPNLTDITGDKLLFDYRTGVLRESRIYSIDDLKNMAKGGGFMG